MLSPGAEVLGAWRRCAAGQGRKQEHRPGIVSIGQAPSYGVLC